MHCIVLTLLQRCTCPLMIYGTRGILNLYSDYAGSVCHFIRSHNTQYSEISHTLKAVRLSHLVLLRSNHCDDNTQDHLFQHVTLFLGWRLRFTYKLHRNTKLHQDRRELCFILFSDSGHTIVVLNEWAWDDDKLSKLLEEYDKNNKYLMNKQKKLLKR